MLYNRPKETNTGKYTDTKIAIVTNPNIKKSQEISYRISRHFNSTGYENKILDIDNLVAGYDFVFVVGGDGTMLKTARFYSEYATPVMGVNIGRLGFLSLISPEETDTLTSILEGNLFSVQDRIMLESCGLIALNDIVVKGCSSNRTSKFSLHINDTHVYDCIADGIVVSTPTGSTAYGLSAGGPVLSPELQCVVIVPICPHTMTVRPLVIPDTEKITIKSDGLNISADGQQNILKQKEMIIKKSKYSAKLVFPEDKFYKVLKNKLYWGATAVSE